MATLTASAIDCSRGSSKSAKSLNNALGSCSWLEHIYSSQAGDEALNADHLRGNFPWDVSSDGSLRELLWFQHHIVAGKLAGCNEQLLLLKLQAANALHLFSIRSSLGSTGP